MLRETIFQRAKRLLLDEYYQTPKRWEDYQIISRVIEKETPLLVKEETRGAFPSGDGRIKHTTYRCPCCDKLVHLDWLTWINYCVSCGQRIILPGNEDKLEEAYKEECWMAAPEQKANKNNYDCGDGGEIDDKGNQEL